MAITVETTTNCRVIDRRALGTEKRLCEPAKALLGILDRACGDSFSVQPLTQYQLSRLLWASQAWRSMPLAISVYVAAIDGLYRFDADTCMLKHVVRSDVRILLAAAGLSTNAPVSLLYVADLEGLPGLDARQQEVTAAICVGHCSQNVILTCVAEGLATAVRVSSDVVALARVMGLRDSQRLLLMQAVGLPAMTRA